MSITRHEYERIMRNKYGKRYDDYRELYNHSTEKCSFPLEIDLDIIDACNLACPACHSIGRKRSGAKMTMHTIKKIAEECGNNNMSSINFGGCSEPLLDSDLTIKAIKVFLDAGVMDVFLHTNAILMDEVISAKLIESGVTYLCVSIDAVSPEVYCKVRGGNYNLVFSNINRFLEIRGNRKLPVLRVSFLEVPDNVKEKSAFVNYWNGKADFVEVQKFYKSYETQPQQLDKTASPVRFYTKRVGVVAPDILTRTCNGIDTAEAVKLGNTLEKFGSIANFVKHL